MKPFKTIVLNSLIAWGLVFTGGIVNTLSTTGLNDIKGLCLSALIGFFAGLIVFLTKIQTYLTKDKKGSIALLEFI